ncbi:hypothetical protein AAGG74_17290 [Bacillus mexicanus]|uniref:hypothetical protein n=1 Tax=Bacillus mexicanus TaxID=2834415 RepID=UPI003D1B6954
MKKNEINYQEFKNMITKFIKLPIIESQGDPWVLKVKLTDELILKMELENIWNQYLKTREFSILLNYIQAQKEGLMSLQTNGNDYEELKGNLIPTIRSDKFIDNLKAGDNVIKKNIGGDLNALVILDEEKFTKTIDRELYDFLPEDCVVFKDAMNNLLQKGWIEETKLMINELFDLYIFEEKTNHSSHFQFFVNEWMDMRFGDCYIAFPTNKIALVLKLKNIGWKDHIESLNYFEKVVRNIYISKEYSLSDTIIKYQDGKHELL